MDSRSAAEETPGPPGAPTPANRPELSEREREILILVATGASNKLIAQQLVISPNTVKVHVRNIFAKIGVASRTEAALFAIREGLVQINGELPQVAAEEPAAADPASAPPPATPSLPARRAIRWVWALAALLLAVVLLTAGLFIFRPANPPPTPTPTQTLTLTVPPVIAMPRWTAEAAMPTARAGLAVATYENQIYAIGGETAAGITGIVERYDLDTKVWLALTAKPVAVTDVAAVVIGGQIYVPGGRLADGGVTDVLEVYLPRQDVWETRAPLPQALSGYALAAFEGHLYLFGGWDGAGYVSTVLEYSPDQDEWQERTPMPTARGFAGAAVANGKIYVLGGADATGPLAANEEYVPEQDISNGDAWSARAALPEPRRRMGVVSVANIVHLVGGEGGAQPMVPLEYFPQANEWKAFEVPPGPAWSGLGLTVVETVLHGLGGRTPLSVTAQHQSYQAIFTVSIPVVP